LRQNATEKGTESFAKTCSRRHGPVSPITD
jgi:hypothetical protein